MFSVSGRNVHWGTWIWCCGNYWWEEGCCWYIRVGSKVFMLIISRGKLLFFFTTSSIYRGITLTFNSSCHYTYYETFSPYYFVSEINSQFFLLPSCFSSKHSLSSNPLFAKFINDPWDYESSLYYHIFRTLNVNIASLSNSYMCLCFILGEAIPFPENNLTYL